MPEQNLAELQLARFRYKGAADGYEEYDTEDFGAIDDIIELIFANA